MLIFKCLTADRFCLQSPKVSGALMVLKTSKSFKAHENSSKDRLMNKINT